MPLRMRNTSQKTYNRDSFYRTSFGSPSKPQSKIQIQSRSPLSTVTYVEQAESIDNMSGITAYGEQRPPISRRALEETGPPRSSAPFSLEDLVKFKPGRGRTGKGGKWVGSLDSDFEFDKSDSKEESIDPLEANSSYNAGSRAPEMLLSQTFVPPQYDVRVQSDLPQPAINCGAPSLKPETFSKQDGDFRLETLINGDLSVFQWSESGSKWLPLGQIDKSEVSFFTRFYERSYSDNRSNAENWKLYKAHIVATVKQLSEKRRKSFEKLESPRRFGSEAIQYTPLLQYNPSSDFTVQTRNKTAARSMDSFPPLPKLLHEPSSGVAPIANTTHGATSPSYQKTEQRDTFPTMFKPQRADNLVMETGNTTNASTSIESKIQSTFRELERKKARENMVVQRYQTAISNNLPDANESSQRFFERRLVQSPWNRPIEPSAMRNANEATSLRRTVLRDPLKERSQSFQYMPNGHGIQNWRSAQQCRSTPKPTFSPFMKTEPGQSNENAHATLTHLQELVKESEADPIAKRPLDFVVRPDMSLQTGQRSKPERPNNFDHTSYEEALDKFWYSGTVRNERHMSLIDKMLAERTENVSQEAEIGYRVLLSVLRSFEDYKFSKTVRAAGGRDHFAPFVEPPKWCVDDSPRSEKPGALFEDDDGERSPSSGRTSQDSTQRKPPVMNRGLATLGMRMGMHGMCEQMAA